MPHACSPAPGADTIVADHSWRSQVPQFVALTFDDGFGLENGGIGGVSEIVRYCSAKRNAGVASGGATFDASPVRATFYLTTIYGEDPSNLAAWRDALEDGHEIGNHSRSHPNGGDIPVGTYNPQAFNVAAWKSEISDATQALIARRGLGARAEDIIGFRAPFLSYNDAMFAAVAELGFSYDSSVLGGFSHHENGRNCHWPYRLDHGSPDADTLALLGGPARVGSYKSLWEVPVSAFFVPPDECAHQYGLHPGLTEKTKKGLRYPSIGDPARGKIAGLDFALLMDYGLTPSEMAAVLKYTLDLRLAGNRSPLVIAAHTFMYAFSRTGINSPNTSSPAEREARWLALVEFIEYALTKPEVRLRPVRDIVTWMEQSSQLEMTGIGNDLTPWHGSAESL
jgi:peptidoglycan/xylan/chitin deacetylase (PgdA/CDA1 family)